jgi:pimeloyl-ACP methyl ester carboxylesterase
MSISMTAVARTQFAQVRNETYAYRRFGGGAPRPLVLLQHFMGTLDNWDPAVTDALASGREVILFDNAGVGRSSGKAADRIADMALHAMAFLDGLGVRTCDVLGFSLGGMIAQQIAAERPSLVPRMILVGTAPRGGHDIMHVEKPSLAKVFQDGSLRGYARLPKLFFAPTESSQRCSSFTNPSRVRLGRF